MIPIILRPAKAAITVAEDAEALHHDALLQLLHYTRVDWVTVSIAATFEIVPAVDGEDGSDYLETAGHDHTIKLGAG